MMQIHTNAILLDPAGEKIKNKDSLKYLGALLQKTGRCDPEINNKMGIARQQFRALSQIWKHAHISRRRKIQLYKAIILSKFMYGLQTIWLPKSMRQKINGFHCSCLRQILGIAHSYIFRVSNLEVLQKAGEIALDKQLLRYQLLFYGKVMRNIDHPIHDFFKKQATQRRRGRPHLPPGAPSFQYDGTRRPYHGRRGGASRGSPSDSPGRHRGILMSHHRQRPH